MTKGKRKGFWRKQARAKEKQSTTPPAHDAMMGRVARRGWGKVVAK